MRITFTAKMFAERNEWRNGLLSLAHTTVLKSPRMMQSVFYLLGYTREQVCQEGSNKFFWKYAKQLLNEEFLEKLVAFNVYGLKTNPIKAY
jgi:hypothetical protein